MTGDPAADAILDRALAYARGYGLRPELIPGRGEPGNADAARMRGYLDALMDADPVLSGTSGSLDRWMFRRVVAARRCDPDGTPPPRASWLRRLLWGS